MIIDILCGIIVGFCFYLGYTKGIIKTVFGVLSIIIGLLATLKFSHILMGLLDKVIDVDPRIMIILGFVLTFLLILIGIRMIGNALEKLLETAHINFINQIAGGFVSALIALVIYSSIVGFCDKIKIIKDEVKTSSITFPILATIPDKSKDFLEKAKPFFSEFWQRTQDAINKADQSMPEKELLPEEAK